MGIRFYCPNGHKLNVKTFLAGRRGICPHCGVKLIIPTEEEAANQESLPVARQPEASREPAAEKTASAQEKAGSQTAAPKRPQAPAAASSGGRVAVPEAKRKAGQPPDASDASAGGQAAQTAPRHAANQSDAAPAAASSGNGERPSGSGFEIAEEDRASGNRDRAVVAESSATTQRPPSVSGALAAAPAGVPAATTEGPPPSDPLAELPNAYWYVQLASGEQYGPAVAATVKVWLAEQRIPADAYVWREDWTDWQPAAQVLALYLAPPTAGGAAAFEPPSADSGSNVTSAAARRRQRRRQRRRRLLLGLLTAVVIALALLLMYVIRHPGAWVTT